MYNPDLERLIELALLDGELSEKERLILFKKAESFGVDLDEFEIVLEARLFEKKSEIADKSSAKTSPPVSTKLGDVKKCPGCGAIVESFISKCPDCSTEFRNVEASQSISKFFDQLNELETTRRDEYVPEKNSGISFGTIIKWWFFWWILIPYKLVTFISDKSKPAKWSTTDSRKEEMIMNFPVPNSKEDLLEFLTLASSKINTISFIKVLKEDGKYESKWNRIWMRKLEQIHSKAKISLKDDKSSLNEIGALVGLAEAKEKTTGKSVKIIFIIITTLILVIAFIVYRTVANKSAEGEEQAHIVEQAEELIRANNFEEALIVIDKIKNKNSAVSLKSEMQLVKLIGQLDELEALIEAKEFSKLQLSLDKLVWEKIGDGYSLDGKERDYFMTFCSRKEAINNQLPDAMRVEVQDEYSFL